MKKIGVFVMLLIVTASLSRCGKQPMESDLSYITYDSVPTALPKDTAFIDSLYNVKYDSATPASVMIDSTKYFVVEGDLLLDEYEYNQYKLSKLIAPYSMIQEKKLVGIIIDGDTLRWPKNYVIRYSIAKNTFRTPAQYNIVKENMKAATREWQQACNVKYFYDESKDEQNILTATGDLTFVVVGFDSRGGFIASAFFPNDPVSERRVLLDPTYFTTNFDKIGVLRHELGHVIGFRHEHIREEAPFVCQGERTAGTVNVTPYDPKSVMHYFCGRMGTIKLEITDIDRKGSQDIYGLPVN